MDEREALRQLGMLAGVEMSYWDAMGRYHEVSDESLRAILGAMGFSARDRREIEASTVAIVEAPWRRPLDAVMVAAVGADPLRVPLVAAADDSSYVFGWRLYEEDGPVHKGEFRPDALPLVETREVDGRYFEKRLLEISLPLPTGYHRLALAGPGVVGASMSLIVTPGVCHLPPDIKDGSRTWGFAVQLYALRSARNWGIGDFGDLGQLTDRAARLGAGVIGLNPLHALYPATPQHCSPYSPSSRVFLNVLYIDVAAVPEYSGCASARRISSDSAFQEELAALRIKPMVDYEGVARAKLQVLDRLYYCFRARHLGRGKGGSVSARGKAFRRFQKRGGADLELLAVFETLREHFLASGAFSWHQWPEPFRDPTSPEVERFADERRERVEFFQYLQFVAEEQLAEAARVGTRRHMAVGLYGDLALGADSNGAEVWSNRRVFAFGASVGAPPDALALKGQDWGLPPYNPHALRAAAYRPFVALLRANMRHCGALRIDHVMMLTRLFWIPWGMRGDQGGYVRYPLDDLLGILALESQRNRCLVIGEALGTVPDGFRERLAAAGVLSYRVLYFERDWHGGGHFLPPAAYPADSLVTATTHDLPPLPGYWRGRDLAVRERLDLFPTPEGRDDAFRGRERERRLLLDALVREGLLPPDVAMGERAYAEEIARLVEAAYRFLARSAGRVLMVQFEDLLGQEDQINVPGTVDQHPNWQRKLELDGEALLRDPRVLAVAATLTAERPPARPPAAPRRR